MLVPSIYNYYISESDTTSNRVLVFNGRTHRFFWIRKEHEPLFAQVLDEPTKYSRTHRKFIEKND